MDEREEQELYWFSQSSYYMMKWSESARPQLFSGWNWAAFFLPMFWLPLRKMYGWTFIFLLLSEIDLLFFTGSWFGWLICLFFGLFGNALYYRHARNKIKTMKATEADPVDQRYQISKAGGTSHWIVLIFMMIALSFLFIFNKVYQDLLAS
ncbi:hypothetical protein ACFO25_09250 [Paenactinomyces guangxiensis]|uniref:DUF2628 domain-containing protein n=1 Tax=Paenactinomyces guangxiensis TaxID=1490290 RepID=A0A7W2A742_9BACL|nr:hypothetical protein [Paenactinomyces guangxiensis]MBA4492769.1 hypothetical protein [Paenactinomyces guangxiensis]MBH8590382.1 hypothetical protein [Paenactinomyces guangxiensis]